MIQLHNQDCLDGIKTIKEDTIDVILTDPPYLYLKGQKLERPFDEKALFLEWKRVLKKNGFIVLFGRGESFYRWNYLLSELGFKFKEEIIWDKGHCTSPLMSLSRVHETISIWTKGKGVLNKVKVPYLEMKKHNIAAIVTDIKKLKAAFNNTKSLDAVLRFLELNENTFTARTNGFNPTVSSDIEVENRIVHVFRSIRDGMNEKSIIRDDRELGGVFTKHYVTSTEQKKQGNRTLNVMQSILAGMNEKTIVKESRNHFSAIHPTEKPVRLLQRLLALVSKEGDRVLDCFGGSFSTAEACYNIGRNFIGFEIDKEYFEDGKKRIEGLHPIQGNLFV